MTPTAEALDPDELPLLGEPLPIEFANTRYGAGNSAMDFLSDGRALRHWLHHVAADPPLPTPRTDHATAQTVRELRDAIREVLDALATGSALSTAALDTVNRYAAHATYHASLDLDGRTGALSVRTVYTGTDPLAELLGRIATETIALAADAVPTDVRRCQGPGCTMLFLRDHHRRRWCHPSCGHRARQADYYRRTVNRRTPPRKRDS